MTLESLAQPWRPEARPSRRELAIAAVLLSGLVAVVWGPSVGMGGWWVDDWALLLNFRFDPGSPTTPWGYVAANDLYESYRPGNRVLTGLIQWAFGESHAPRLAIGFGLGALQAFLLYLVLRLAGLTAAAAAVPAALMAVLPSLDTARVLWSAFHHTAGACLYLGGLAVAIAGLRAAGRSAVARHATALALYAAALFTYEAFAPLVALSGAVYLLAGRRVRPALGRWAADLALLAAGLPLAIGQAHDIRPTDLSPAGIWDRAGDTFGAATRILEFTLPGDQILRTVPGVAIAVVLAGGVALALRRGSPLAPAARSWLVVAAAGTVFLYAGLVSLLGGTVAIEPSWRGASNRVTVGMSAGQVVLVTALLWLGAIGAAELVRRRRLAAPLAAVAATLAVLALAGEERGNLDDWRQSRAWQQRSLDLVGRALGPRPPRDAVAIVFGQPYWSPRGAPVFLVVDMTMANQLRYGRQDLIARPTITGDVCLPAGYGILGLPDAGGKVGYIVLAYANLRFVDWRDGSSRRVRDQAQCTAESTRLLRGQPSFAYPSEL
ncbi:MAG TPA: hypothetical protein VNB64_04120 [Solirubrobacteraceae bacterium]|nr:hypothetical protein [Solirubrobacteraceae bacterium]